MQNDLLQSSQIKSELSGNVSSAMTTVALRNDAYKILSSLAEEHKQSRVLFLASLVIALQSLSHNDITLLLKVGEAKTVEADTIKQLPETAKFIMNVGKLIVIPLNYYKALTSNQRSHRQR